MTDVGSAGPGTWDEWTATQARLAEAVHRLSAAVSDVPTIRARLQAERYAALSSRVEELGVSPGGLAAVVAPPQSSNLELITGIIVAYATAGVTGAQLQLGNRTLPLPVQPVTVLSPVGFLLHGTDTRQLVLTGATPAAFLALFGEEVPSPGGVY